MEKRVSKIIGPSDLTIETGKLAKLADGSVTVRSGETIILVAAVSATSVKAGQDFFPLTVDYREKAAAVGKFPGGYFKREGRPSEKETLTSRMTDRPLRPLFPKGYFYDTQVISVLLSADGENDPDILSINGASAAFAFLIYRLPGRSERSGSHGSMENLWSTRLIRNGNSATSTWSMSALRTIS